MPQNLLTRRPDISFVVITTVELSSLLERLETDEDTVVKFLGHSVIYYRISWRKINVTILPQRFIKAEHTIGEYMFYTERNSTYLERQL